MHAIRLRGIRVTSRRQILRTAAIAGVLGFAIDLQTKSTVADSELIGPQFSPAQRKLIASMADTILPRTQTPGAEDVAVVDFIEFIYRRGMLPAARTQFLRGLHAFVDDAAKNTPRRATADQRARHLDAIDHELFAAAQNDSRSALLGFYAIVKRLTIVGYYTSQRGALSELNVQLFPGVYKANEPFNSGVRTFYEDSFGVPLERPLAYATSRG